MIRKTIAAAIVGGILGIAAPAAAAFADDRTLGSTNYGSASGSASNRQATLVMPGCLTNTICFYNTASDPGPIQIFSGNIVRNTCLDDVPDNLTSYIQNRTGVRWRVSVENDCGGVLGQIYPNSEGPMSGPYNNSIQAAIRTSLTSKHAGPLMPGWRYI